MNRSRTVQVAVVLTAALALTAVMVVSSASHEGDDDPAVQTSEGPGPEPGRPVVMPKRLIGLEIRLGLKDTAPTDWEGDIRVSEGRVVAIDVDRSGPGARVEGTRFVVETAKAKQAAAKKKVPAKKKQDGQAKKKQDVQAKKKQAAVVGPVLAVTLDAPKTAEVTVKTGEGQFSFTLAELDRAGRQTFLDGQAAVERTAGSVRLTGKGTEDDYPAVARGPDGSVWLVSVAYHPQEPVLTKAAKITRDNFDEKLVPTRHGDRIELRRFDGTTWHPALPVTAKGLDVWRPAVAVDGRGVVWVAWAQQVDGNWDIYKRGYTPPGKEGGEGRWSDVVRVTTDPGSDFHVVAATDSEGTVWLAWQAWCGDNYDILAAAQKEGHPWNTPRSVSESPANDWSPALAADGKGNVYAAWDTYEKGNYDVRLRNLAKDSGARTVAGSARFEGRSSLACDARGRVWIAYEEGDEQWGKDFAHAPPVTNVGLEKNPGYALYIKRTVRVKCLVDDTQMQPAGSLDQAFQGKIDRNKSVPRLAVDEKGGVWLLVRHHPLPGGQGEAWVSSYLRYDGRAWSPPRRLANSSNLIDNRPALAPLGTGVLAVYSTDHRTSTQNRREDDLYAALLTPHGSETRDPELAADAPAPKPEMDPVHPDELDDVARVRGYRVEAGGKSLRLFRGEFHRHTEFSAHNDGDGLLEDTWRYALDAGRLDWMGNGDHDNGFGHEYMWWLIQKNTDLHHNSPHFIAAQTYERSVVYPNGHRNVMMPRRGIRPLPRGELPGTAEEGAPDTKRLYAYLMHFGGICASHTSATDMGTDWRDNDPAVEPVVEIYQGHRHNYEHFGAPKAPTKDTQIGGYEPAGFIWNALEKGYKLGFQSSSDHISTHLSYAVVLAEDVSRQGIIDAFKKRHCYAATDNIVLDVRSGAHLMGDTFTTADKPTIAVTALGTEPIAKVDVVRDNKYVFTTEPGVRRVRLSYTDDDARPGESHYYYVRIRQSDGNLAWASPMWITRER